MKKIFWLVTLFLTLFSCKENPKEVNYALISGNVKNSKEAIIKIGNYDRTFKKEITIDELGNFKDTLYIDKDGFYSFQIGYSYSSIFFKKGDNLSISLDAKDFYNTIHTTGKGSVLNNYYIERVNLKSKLVGDAKEFFVVPVQDFLTKIQKNKDIFLEHLYKANLNEKDLEIQKKMIEYDYLLTKYNYDKFNYYHTKEHPKLPENYYDSIINMDIDDEESFHYIRSYRTLIVENWRFTSKIAAKNNPDYNKISFVKNKIKDIKSIKIREQIISMLFREVSAKNKNFEKAYNEILPMLTSDY